MKDLLNCKHGDKIQVRNTIYMFDSICYVWRNDSFCAELINTTTGNHVIRKIATLLKNKAIVL